MFPFPTLLKLFYCGFLFFLTCDCLRHCHCHHYDDDDDPYHETRCLCSAMFKIHVMAQTDKKF